MFVIAGEALIDFIAAPDGRYQPVAGGAPFNFSRALALQGINAGYANPFSGDGFGLLLRESLVASGAKALGTTLAKPTSLALVSKTADGQPRYQFYRDGVADRELALPQLNAHLGTQTIGFHSGGLALMPPDHEIIVAAQQNARNLGILCTVDVNMRPQVASSMGIALADYRDAALAVIRGAHIVKVSDEDLQHLNFSAPPVEAARGLLSDTCKLIVLTLGASGAWIVTKTQTIFQAVEVVKVRDTVGAGDCFFAGFIAALIRDGAIATLRTHDLDQLLLERALRHASHCAAINITREGCQPPTWDEAVQISA
jgi:fructokinase